MLLILNMSRKVFCLSSPIFTDPLFSLAQFTTQVSSSRHQEMNCWGSLQLFCAATLSLLKPLFSLFHLSSSYKLSTPFSSMSGDFIPSSKGQSDDVTYLRMTRIRPGAAWLSLLKKIWSSLLSLVLSSLISSSPCQTLKTASSFTRREVNWRCIPRLLSAFCFTHGCSLIYCLSDWLTHWLLAVCSVCASLVNSTVNVRQRQAGGLAAEKLT